MSYNNKFNFSVPLCLRVRNFVTIFLITILLILASCVENNPPVSQNTPPSEETNDDSTIQTEIGDNNNTENNNNEEENEQENEDNDDMEESYEKLELTAQASSGSAYSLIQTQGFDYESPSQDGGSKDNAHFGQPHILQQYDAELQKNVFAFVTHHATDRNATGDWTRQRVEIKIDHRQGSPGRDFCGLQDEEGRSFIHRWKFKLPADFAISGEFTHLHQIKNEGGLYSSQPIVTLTARTVSGNDRMQLTYYTQDAGGSQTIQLVNNNTSNLDQYRGHWVQCEETITYSSDPAVASYSIKITRISDGAVLMNFTAPAGTVTWREGNTHGRPKFGLYRRIYTGSNPGSNTEPSAATGNIWINDLKDETILFADFEIERIK